jgi:Scd6-like Sm domain
VGTLYSINEANATVALQNVTSFGTEGREKEDPETTFVAPQEGIHAYLLFRGCDIKDLHVHEQPKPADAAPAAADAAPPQQDEPATAKAPPKAPPASDLPPPPQQSPAPGAAANANKKDAAAAKTKGKENQPGGGPKKSNNRGGGRGGAQVGTGASLLNRKARGSVQSGKQMIVDGRNNLDDYAWLMTLLTDLSRFKVLVRNHQMENLIFKPSWTNLRKTQMPPTKKMTTMKPEMKWREIPTITTKRMISLIPFLVMRLTNNTELTTVYEANRNEI